MASGGTQRSPEVISVERSFTFSPTSSSSSEAGFLPYREVQAQHPGAQLLVATLTVVETSAFIPTLWMEQQLGHAIEPFVLRLALMLLRLYSLWRMLAICMYYCGLCRCVTSLPLPLQWRCRQLRSESCSRLPEIRWGVVVTLDLWYLLATQLVVGAGGSMATMCITLLIINSLLCTLDILALVVLLLYGKQNVAEIYPEVTFHRPKAIKWGIREGGADSTCAICLSEFGDGESVQLLPCGHVFHTDCIAHWLQVSHYCPMRCPELVLPPRIDFAAAQLPRESHGSGTAESIVTQYDGPLFGSSVRGDRSPVDLVPELLVLPGQVPRGSSSS